MTENQLDLRCWGALLLMAGLGSRAALAQGQVVGWGGGAARPSLLLKTTQIACGPFHNYALKVDGTLVGWGENVEGRLDTPSGLGGVTQVACGGLHTYALRQDGSLVGWGSNSQGILDTPTPNEGWSEVTCGEAHTYALKPSGDFHGWGRNDEGQLTPPAWVGPAMQIACGSFFTYEIRNDGVAVGWGQDDFGQLGTPNFSTFRQIACGRSHVCAVRDDGTVMAWGAITDVPEGLSDVRKVVCGAFHTYALRNDGSVVAWGDNVHGQARTPSDLPDVAMVGCGDRHTYVLTTDGKLIGWGDGTVGQLGTPESQYGVVQVACGGGHAYMLKQDGTLIGRGSNSSGQIDTPPGLAGVMQVACGVSHTYALLGDGTLVGWGLPWNGQIDTPAGLDGVTQVSCGDWHTYARRSDGTLVGWGGNFFGQISTPADLVDATQVACGWYHTYALRSDGTVIGWGDNFWGQLLVPDGLAGVAQIACGKVQTCALLADGTVASWGSGSGPPPELGGVTQLACGESFSYALKGDGTLVGWGDFGALDTPSGLAGVTQVACGSRQTLALLSPALSSCDMPTAPGTATIAVSGSSWQQVQAWTWSDGGSMRVPGPLADVDFGSFGSVGSECSARCATLSAASGASLLVPASASQPGNDFSIRVENTANLAGRVWLLGVTGANGRLPEGLDLPVLSAGSVNGFFDLIQTDVPPPPGFFLTLVPSDINGRTVLSLKVLPLPGGAGLAGANTGAFSGVAVAAETIDVNHDGFDDLALVVDFGTEQDGLIQILLNDGSGNLGGSSVLRTIPPQPTCLAVGDVNGDGRADVVVGIASDASARVYVDDGQGGLAADAEISGLDATPTAVIVLPPSGVFLRPGGASVGVGLGGNKLKIFSNGALQQEIALAGVPSTVRGGNTGGTQGRDIVTGGSKSASIQRPSATETGFVQVLRVQQDGLYAVEQTMLITARPVGMDVADIDGDGLDDIVTANADPVLPAVGSALPVLSIFRNSGGTFGGGVPYQPTNASSGLDVSLLDVDNDGDRDIVNVYRRVSVDTEAALLRVDTLGPGTPLSIGETTVLDAGSPILSARGNLDGIGGEDLYLVDTGAGANVTGSAEVKPYLAVGGARQGDLDGDGSVNTADIALLLLDFGPCPGCASDLDGDGEVNTGDVALLLLLFG